MTGDVEAPSLRERKKARTREALTEAAIRLFVTEGYERTTVDDIAAAVDISPRTFFRYFASKEDVVRCFGDEEISQVVAVLRASPPAESLLTSLRAVVLAHAGEWERDRDLMRDQVRLTMETPALKARYLETVDVGVAAIADVLADRSGGGRAARFRARVLASAVMATATAVVAHWVEEGGTDHLPTLMHEALDVLGRDLGEV